MSDDFIIQTLNQNKNKDFVQRILFPEKSPTIKNADGSYSTHKMAWAGIDNGYIVYPTIVRNSRGKLVELNGKDAIDHAIFTGEYIKFKTPDEADFFSKNYKNVWKQK